MSALATLGEIIADMGGDTPGTVGHRLAEARDAVAELIAERNRLTNIVNSHEAQIVRMTTERGGLVEDARQLACALAGAYAALEMEPPPAVAPLLDRHLGIKDGKGND